MSKFKINFTGRQRLAIGIFHACEATIEVGEDRADWWRDQIAKLATTPAGEPNHRLRLELYDQPEFLQIYDGFEHVLLCVKHFNLREITDGPSNETPVRPSLPLHG